MKNETLTEALERFRERGYGTTFRSEGRLLRHVASGELCRAADVIIEEVARFEEPRHALQGTVVLALRYPPHDWYGTYVIDTRSERTPPVDRELLGRLSG